jgi:hypothetical protein
MSGHRLQTAGGRQRALVVLLAVAVLCVPALVRATDSPKGSAPPLLRLNRGFNGPESKARLGPPAAQPVDVPVIDDAEPAGTSVAAPLLFVETLTSPAADVSPIILRGPPAFAHAR